MPMLGCGLPSGPSWGASLLVSSLMRSSHLGSSQKGMMTTFLAVVFVSIWHGVELSRTVLRTVQRRNHLAPVCEEESVRLERSIGLVVHPFLNGVEEFRY